MIDRKVFQTLKSVMDEDEVLDLEEQVERTPEQKIEDWSRLRHEYSIELRMLKEREADLIWFIDRLEGMIDKAKAG